MLIAMIILLLFGPKICKAFLLKQKNLLKIKASYEDYCEIRKDDRKG